MKKLILGFSIMISMNVFAAPVTISMQEAMTSFDSLLPTGEYQGDGCKVTVERNTRPDNAVIVRVSQQQPDGSYHPYYSGDIRLYTGRRDVISITKDISRGAFNLVLKAQWAMDLNGPFDPANIFDNTLKITSNSVTIQSSPKPAYSCEIR